MSISKAKKSYLINKHSGKCFYCGILVSPTDRCIDHIKPKSDGGSNRVENLVLCCRTCNSIKHKNSIEHFRISMRLRASKFYGVISAVQYQKLINLGVEIELPEHQFHFEMDV